MISRGSVKVLVVDDTPAKRYAKVRTLEQAGFQVLQAAAGNEALLRAAQADVVVLDVFLPDISGFDVCRTLRQRTDTCTLPIIHVSSVFIEDVHVRDGAQAGADAYLIEPVPADVLIQVIESALGARQAAPPDAGACEELHAITYTSAAVRLPSDEQLLTLLEKSRARNLREGITGVLLYSDGTFLQYLEGPRPGLLRVYGSIQADPLHHHIFEMLNEPINQREFAGWSMGFRGSAPIRGAARDAVLDKLLSDESDKLAPGRLLLNAFWSKGLGARYLAALANKR